LAELVIKQPRTRTTFLYLVTSTFKKNGFFAILPLHPVKFCKQISSESFPLQSRDRDSDRDSVTRFWTLGFFHPSTSRPDSRAKAFSDMASYSSRHSIRKLPKLDETVGSDFLVVVRVPL
jgi:hypothetical protein